jgi:copper chaperone
MTTSTDGTVAVCTVAGMRCGHCAKSPTEEVSVIPGVGTVEVELSSGQVTLMSASPGTRSDGSELAH